MTTCWCPELKAAKRKQQCNAEESRQDVLRGVLSMFYGLDDYARFPIFLSLVVSWSFGSFPEGHVAAAEQSWKYLKPSLLCSQLMSACGNRQNLGKIRPQLPALLQPARKNTRRSFDKMCQPDFHRFSINPNLQNDKFAPHGESLTPKIPQVPQVPHFNFLGQKIPHGLVDLQSRQRPRCVLSFFPRNRDERIDRIGWIPSQKFRKVTCSNFAGLQSEHCHTTKPRDRLPVWLSWIFEERRVFVNCWTNTLRPELFGQI